MTEIELPIKKIKAETQDPKRFVLAAKPKAGKTTAVANLPNCLLLDLEDGARSIDALKVKIDSYEDLLEVCKSIYKSKHKYDYIAIDTATKLEEFCEWEATENYMNTTIGKKFNRDSHGNILQRKDWASVLTLPQGGGYYYVRLAFRKWMDRFDKLCDKIIYVSHIKDKFINENGTEVNVNSLDLTGKLAGIVAASADAIGFLYVDRKTGETMITFDSKYIEGGARQEHLKGKTFKFFETSEDGKLEKVNWDKIYLE